MLSAVADRIVFNLGVTGWLVLAVKVASTVVAWRTGEQIFTFR